jgi:hypothetical protein
MDEYMGLAFFPDHPKIVPIPSLQAEFSYRQNACYRRQFPVVLASAITINKSQGLTLPKTVVGLGKKEMVGGITFVAISRVKRIEDLAFAELFHSHD